MGNDEWVETLESAGLNSQSARLGEGSAVAIDVTDSPQLVNLASLSIIDIQGEDAASFLQGQFSNDLTQVTSTRAQITGYCTPKGRLLALPMVVGLQDGYRLLLPEAIKEGFVKRLSMFVMRAKVTITERTGWVCTGIVASEQGDLAPISAQLGSLPGSVLEAVGTPDGQVIRWHDMSGTVSRARYLVLAGRQQQLSLWQAGKGLPAAGAALWRLGDIRAGIPSITAGVLESFVPQMVNLQLVGALSFTKGCYPGQEIVARMHYLGKLKRHMRRFSMPTGAIVPVPGTKVSAEADSDAGVVVDAIAGPSGEIELLAVVKISSSQLALSIDDQALVGAVLPYELPSLSDSQQNAG